MDFRNILEKSKMFYKGTKFLTQAYIYLTHSSGDLFFCKKNFRWSQFKGENFTKNVYRSVLTNAVHTPRWAPTAEVGPCTIHGKVELVHLSAPTSQGFTLGGVSSSREGY